MEYGTYQIILCNLTQSSACTSKGCMEPEFLYIMGYSGKYKYSMWVAEQAVECNYLTTQQNHSLKCYINQ
jgi:hypothetical protein